MSLTTASILVIAGSSALVLLASVRAALAIAAEVQITPNAAPDARGERAADLIEDGPRVRLALLTGGLLAAAAVCLGLLIGLEFLWPSLGVHARGGLAALVATPLLVVFGEILPQALAIRRPETILRRLGPLVGVLKGVLYPLIRLAEALSRALDRRAGTPAANPEAVDHVEGLRTLVVLNRHEGLEETGKELIENVYAFGDATARELMTPRSDLQMLSADATTEEVLAFVHREQFSRVPIVDERTGQILGILYAKDLLGRPLPFPPLRELTRPLYVVPETTSAEEIFEKLRARRIHMAIVVDEYGAAVGAVTMEDLLEELFGEIYDEYDERETLWSAGAEPGTFVISGTMDVEDFNETAGASLPLDVADSMAGFVFHGFGVVPAEGDVLESEGWRFEVLKVDGARIAELKATRPSSAPLGDAGAPEEPVR